MRFQEKQAACSFPAGKRAGDSGLLGSTAATSNLMVESPIAQIQGKSTKERFQEQIRARTVREMQEREGAAPCEHRAAQTSLPAFPTPQEPSPQHTHSLTPLPSTFLPPCKNKVQLSRGRGRCRNNSERRRKAGTDGRGPRKADRLKLETRILDEEDQGKSRTSIRWGSWERGGTDRREKKHGGG